MHLKRGLTMKKRFLSFVFGLFAAICLAACSANNNSGSNPVGGSIIPTYQGMTVSHSSSITNRRELNRNDDDPEIDDHDDHYEDIETDITDIVTIDVQTDDEVKYYIKPNETFIIEVHLSNPNDYEIQSFTLNGKKYANYMFKDGSTMELLLLETTAPSTSGYIEYTIDAIKYIDGTEIKDVDMSKGDKSIKAGVSYTQAPTASITSYNVNTTYIEMDINVSDSQNIIGTNQLSIYLSDGEKAIGSKDLKVGNNSVKFDNLVMSKTYQYGIITAYDFVDGKDIHSEWILTNTFTTLGAYKISNVNASKTSITFDVSRTGEVGIIDSISLFDAATNELVNRGDSSVRSFNGLLSNHTYNLYVDFSYQTNGETITDWAGHKDITTEAKVAPTLTFDSSSTDKTSVSYSVSTEDADGILSITKVELLKNGESVKDNGTALSGSFTGLLSNNKYSVKVSYTYDLNDGQGIISNSLIKDITTEAKVAPVVSISNDVITDTTIVSDIDFEDVDSVGFIDSVKIYKDEDLVSINSSKIIDFSDLECYTDYKVIITYKYDLNDGQGVQTSTTEKNYKTSPHLEFKSCKIVNTSAVSEGDTIYMQVSLTNPQNALPSSVIINGEQYNCASSTTPTKIFVEIVNIGQFEGGDTLLTIERVNMSLDGGIYSIVPTSNNSDHVFINGIIKIVDFYVCDSEFEKKRIPFCYSSEEAYLGIEVNNKTGYSIDAVTINSKTYDSLIKIDNNHWVICLGNISAGLNEQDYQLTTITYSIESLNKNLSSTLSTRIFIVYDNSPISVTSREQLINLSDGFHCYSLENDIDLSGEEWIGKQLNGVFLGNGHSIKNMNYIGTHYDSTLYQGLFSQVRGIVADLKIESSSIMVDVKSTSSSSYSAYCGLICGSCEVSAIINCQTDDESMVRVTVDDSAETCIGGIVGSMENGIIENCINNAFISGKESVGGIVGSFYNGLSQNSTVSKCTNNGDVSGVGSIGGIVGSSLCHIKDCTNTGHINGEWGVGGISGGMASGGKDTYVINCTNKGWVSSLSDAGGILGRGAHIIISECKNESKIQGNDNVGGIVGGGSSLDISNCSNTGNICGKTGVGGIIGKDDVQWLGGDPVIVSYCANTGTIEGNNMVDGIIGYPNNSTITECLDTGIIKIIN